MTEAVHDVFNFLTAYTDNADYDPLLVSPLGFAEKSLWWIAREAEHARRGRPARIIAKMNSLLDKNIVQELYRAAQAGVEIDLIVRGMCGLRPGVRGVSNRIRVRSIVGRFLEHSRIFYFANGGEEEVYLGSADWMPRNLYERVEVTFPVKDVMLRQRLRTEILEAYLADTAKARLLRSDGSYVRPELPAGARAPGFNAQEFLIATAEGRQNASDIPAVARPSIRTRRKAGNLA
jgi:polyphosphate kinase